MAAPAEMNTLDLTGVFVWNKSAGEGDYEKILELQGVSWFRRKAILNATLYLYVKHYKDDSSVEHIDIDQVLTGGIKGTREERTLDWQERQKDDPVFGAVMGKTRRVKVEEIEDGWLREGWTEDTKETGLVHSYVESFTPKSKTTWVAEQTWGFEVIEKAQNERRYVRHVKFTGPKGEQIQARMVYDYYGTNLGTPADAPTA